MLFLTVARFLLVFYNYKYVIVRFSRLKLLKFKIKKAKNHYLFSQAFFLLVPYCPTALLPYF